MSKATLILLSGLLCDERVWNHQVKHCQNIADIQIPNWSQGATLDDAIAIALINASDKFFIIGHSQGGIIALEIALRYPERILGLCILNTRVSPDSIDKTASRIAMINSTKDGTFPEIANQCANNMLYIESLIPSVRKMFLDNEQMLINQQNIMLNRRDIVHLLDKITCPCLVIHANQDRWFALADAQQIVDRIPNCKLAMIEDCGHMSMLEQAVAVTALINFWLNY